MAQTIDFYIVVVVVFFIYQDNKATSLVQSRHVRDK